MKPGRELDALVAEKVMGLTSSEVEIHRQFWLDGCFSNLPHYSTDIAAAWEVVEKLTSKKQPHFQLSLCDSYTENPKWCAEFDLDRPFKRVIAKAETAPHAICLAALKAVGVEI